MEETRKGANLIKLSKGLVNNQYSAVGKWRGGVNQMIADRYGVETSMGKMKWVELGMS